MIFFPFLSLPSTHACPSSTILAFSHLLRILDHRSIYSKSRIRRYTPAASIRQCYSNGVVRFSAWTVGQPSWSSRHPMCNSGRLVRSSLVIVHGPTLIAIFCSVRREALPERRMAWECMRRMLSGNVVSSWQWFATRYSAATGIFLNE